jgi:hypothetical protein
MSLWFLYRTQGEIAMHPPDGAPLQFLRRQVRVATALSQAHSLQGKVVSLPNQIQATGSAHPAPNGHLTRVKQSQPLSEAFHLINI